MLKKFREFQENVEIADEFDLPLSEEVLVEVASINTLEYDERLMGFWDKRMCDNFVSIFKKLDLLSISIDDELDLIRDSFVYSDFVSCIPEEFFDSSNEGKLYFQALNYVINVLRDKVGQMGLAIAGDRWSEIKNALGIELTEEMEGKRLVLGNHANAIHSFDLILNDEQKLEDFKSAFPELNKVADLFKRKANFDFRAASLIDSNKHLFELMSVDSEELFERIRLINIVINKLIDEESNCEEEISSTPDRLFWDESDDDQFMSVDLLTVEELYEKIAREEFDTYKDDLDTFLKNPTYTRSLLKMFGSFKIIVDRENENKEDVNEIIKAFLEKCIGYAESQMWALETKVSFQECVKEEFRSFGCVLEIVHLIDDLSFEDEDYEYYQPSGIRFINNSQIYIKDFKSVVASMNGTICSNGKSKHASVIIPFEEFTFKAPLPTNFFNGTHPRYARVFINEIGNFIEKNQIESLTYTDFIKMKNAYAEIGIEVEYRP